MYTHKGILFKEHANICHNINRPRGHHAKWKNSKKKTAWYHIYVDLKKKQKPKLIEIETKGVVTRG